MRKEKKTAKAVTLTAVQSYHGGVWNESYAYQGFKANKYFTSDRYITLDANFNRPDGKPLKGFGLEIETECMGLSNQTVYAEVLQNIVFPHFPADLFKMQNDGSLGGDTSAECITQVMTKEFIRNNYANFKLMYDTYFPAFRISCGSNCGMHVNMSNALFGRTEAAQELAIRKLFYITNKHFDMMCALTNRDRNHTGYCRRMVSYIDNAKTVDLDTVINGHGICFNLAHYRQGRIELRIVGGQKNFPCFRNTMESIFHLIDAVKKLSWADCDDLTKVFNGCNQYVYDRLKSKVKQAGAITDAQLSAISGTVVREELI